MCQEQRVPALSFWIYRTYANTILEIAHPHPLSGAETVGSAGFSLNTRFSVFYSYRWLAPCSQFRSIPSDSVSLRQSALGSVLCCHCAFRLRGTTTVDGKAVATSVGTLRAETAKIAKCRRQLSRASHAPVSRSRRLHAEQQAHSRRSTDSTFTPSDSIALHRQLSTSHTFRYTSSRSTRFATPICALLNKPAPATDDSRCQPFFCLGLLGECPPSNPAVHSDGRKRARAVITVFVRLRFVCLLQSGSSGCPAFRSSRWTQEAECQEVSAGLRFSAHLPESQSLLCVIQEDSVHTHP